jgi:hypothetical protein
MKVAALRRVITGACFAVAAALAPAGAHAAWEPTKPVEFIVPAGTVAARTRWRASFRAWSPSTT